MFNLDLGFPFPSFFFSLSSSVFLDSYFLGQERVCFHFFLTVIVFVFSLVESVCPFFLLSCVFFYINSLHSFDKNLSELIILLVLPYFLFLLVLLRVSAFLQPETFSFARFYFHINLNNELSRFR